jgi:hypothetical protein
MKIEMNENAAAAVCIVAVMIFGCVMFISVAFGGP